MVKSNTAKSLAKKELVGMAALLALVASVVGTDGAPHSLREGYREDSSDGVAGKLGRALQVSCLIFWPCCIHKVLELHF